MPTTDLGGNNKSRIPTNEGDADFRYKSIGTESVLKSGPSYWSAGWTSEKYNKRISSVSNSSDSFLPTVASWAVTAAEELDNITQEAADNDMVPPSDAEIAAARTFLNVLARNSQFRNAKVSVYPEDRSSIETFVDVDSGYCTVRFTEGIATCLVKFDKLKRTLRVEFGDTFLHQFVASSYHAANSKRNRVQ